MKGKRRLLGVLMIIGALVIMQLPMKEADAATSASPFKMEGSTLVKYRGTEKNVSVPDTVEVIAKGAFEGKGTIEVVVLPASVKRIDPYAFWGCESLEKIIIGSGLTEIGDYAFANCVGLTDVTIPTNIRRIGIQAFADCVNMTEITIPFQVTDIHETAFDGCSKLVIDCEPGTYADEYAKEFYERQKEMPEYEDVPGYTGDTVTPVTTPTPTPTPDPEPENNKDLLGSTYIVGNQAVVFLDNGEPIVYGTEATKAPEGEMDQPENSESIGDVTTEQTETIVKYSVVDGKSIADQAYYQSRKISNLKLPDGIEEIGEFSFARSALESITLPESLKEISYGAFYHCDNLKMVSLPAGIRNVGPKAFSHTAWVNSFLQWETSDNSDFLISGGVLVAYRGNADKVIVPEGVTVIAAEAFLNHTEINKLELPQSLLVIGEGAFEGCSNLSQLNLSNSVEEIKDRAFAGCNLSKVRLPESVVKLGIRAFDDTVKVSYEGTVPERTYEQSAQRLSNEGYRVYGKLSGDNGVTVQGIKRAYATLAGAKRSYNLSVNVMTENSSLENAFRRNMHTNMPADAAVYHMELKDTSNVPITKLGKQILTVTLPVQDSFKGQELKVYTLDRNGQLELLNSKEVKVDGTDSVQFELDYVSDIAVCTTGIITEEISIVSMSGPVLKNNNPYSFIKWIWVAAVLIVGMCFILKKSK